MDTLAELGPILGNQQLVPTFRERIVEAHAKGKASDERLRQEILDNINLKRHTALLLESAQRDLNRRQWDELRVQLPLNNDSLRAYASLLRRFPEPVDELKIAIAGIKKALMPTGCLPNSPGRGPESLHAEANFFTVATLTVIRLTVAFRKYVARHPLKHWEPQTAELFLRSLQPVVNCYREVSSWLKSTTTQTTTR